MLKPVDIAVAFGVAMTLEQEGRWTPARIRHQFGIPKATLNKSLGRLVEARILREWFINRGVLAALLPVLPNLAPASPLSDVPVRGVVTGFAAPVFGGRFRATLPLVWQLPEGPESGLAITPLHDRLPHTIAASADPRSYALLACLDAVRGGRAREVACGAEGIRRLCGLQQLPGIRADPASTALMKAAIDGLLVASAALLGGPETGDDAGQRAVTA